MGKFTRLTDKPLPGQKSLVTHRCAYSNNYKTKEYYYHIQLHFHRTFIWKLQISDISVTTKETLFCMRNQNTNDKPAENIAIPVSDNGQLVIDDTSRWLINSRFK